MDKVKIRNLISNNKKKVIVALAILLVSILLISIIVYATSNNEDYVVEIKDKGLDNIAENQSGESSTTKKIISETATSLTYEVAINNLKTRSKTPEVAVLVDTSSSMSINDIEEKVKPKAIEFVKGLLSDVKGVKVSISNNYTVKEKLGKVTTSNCTSHINGLVAEQGSNLNNGIDNAISTFSTANNEKHLVIFSDATDSILDKLQINAQNGVKIYSILTDMTNSEYTNVENKDVIGQVQMISGAESFSPIYNKINNNITNVKVKDIFTKETNEYFTLTEGTKDADVVFTKTEDGYELECANIKAEETKKVQFTLTLDEKAQIDSGDTYEELDTSSKMTIEYNDDDTSDKRTYEMKNSPKYVICKKYSLTIQAVSEQSDSLPVKDLDIKVVGTRVKDENEKNVVEEIYNKTLKTDGQGKIYIDELKTSGVINFEIKPLVNQFGYSSTDATTIIVYNEQKKDGTIHADSDREPQPITDVTKRNIDAKLRISTEKFDIKVETVDSNNSNIKLGGIDFRLIQPKLNSKYEMEALYKTTLEDGTLTFNPTIMTEDGTYEYVLSQLNEQDGYDSMGNVTLRVKFDNNGNIKDIKPKHNDNVEVSFKKDEFGNIKDITVTVKNDSQVEDTFRLEINTFDSENNDKKLQGAVYDVEVKRTNRDPIMIKGCITDENGQIKLDVPGTGYIGLKITEVKPATGYHEDTQVKEIMAYRKDGRVEDNLKSKFPLNLDAQGDSDANAVVVNLPSIEKIDKNRIQIHMMDKDERDVKIPGVGLTLINLVNNKTYTAVSDGNGIANFYVNDEEAGSTVVYDIMLTNGLPYGYISSENKLGEISVQFGNGKLIDACSDLQQSPSDLHFTANYQFMPEDFNYHTGLVEIGLQADNANTYNFQVKLVNDANKVVQGAKYDITIESGNIVRKITGRETDKNGMITTKLIGQNEVIITVKETEAAKGHIINKDECVIELRKINGSYQIANQNPPYAYDGNTQKIGAEIIGNNVIYHDLNKGKTGNDTLLNLYINKEDPKGNIIGGVRTVLTSPTLKLAGQPITAETVYSATASSGNVFTLNPAVTDNNGYFEIEGIQVDGEDLTNGERVDYLYMYEIDVNGDKVPNTEMTIKLTFRYNENKEYVELTNAEGTWGNRLLKDKDREYVGRETNIGYESDAHFTILTNYDDVGNFSLDLVKTDKNDNPLQGAKYDVIVTRRDGTKIVRRGIEVTSKVEFEGFLVAEGTTIEITEVEAPIGYELNEYTEILNIKSVDPITNQVTVELESGSYKTPRAYLTTPVQNLVLSDGTIKTCAELKLQDYELDTFKFGIKAVETVNNEPLPGYSFGISTNKGAQSNTLPTDEDGKTSTLVGANYENTQVEYTIDTLKAADYYKKLANPIQVIVVFDINGEVKWQETKAANAAKAATNGYGTIWDVEQANATADGNDIDIRIKIDPEDKLIVNIVSQDRRTKASVTTNEYKIEPCLNIPGIGTTTVEVGYIAPDSIQTYTIHQEKSDPNYAGIEDQIFRIDYDKDGNILNVYDEDGNALNGSTNSGRIINESHSGNEITLTIVIDPKITVNIVSQDRRTKQTITGIEYAITPNEMPIEEESSSNEMPIIGSLYPVSVGYSVVDGQVEYTLTQTNALADYAMLENQKFTVKYDNNDNIVDVINTSSGIIDNTFTNAEITLTVELEPTITVKMISKDRLTGNIIVDNTYRITPSDSRVDSNSEFDENTNEIASKVGYAKPSEVVEYTLIQTNDIGNYEVLDDQTFKVEYDANDNIIDVREESDKIIQKTWTDNEIELTLELEPILPVTVNIKSTDMITGKELYTTQIIGGNQANVYSMQYEISLKEHTQGQGTTKIKDKRFTTGNGQKQLQFNCAIPDGEGTYVLKQTNEINNYVKLDDIEFKIEYDNQDNIKNATTDANNLVVISWNGRTLDIEVKVEPGVPFVISNIGYFDNLPLSNGQFEISSSKPITKTTTTNNNGIGIAYVDKLGQGNTVRYGIKQTGAKIGYCTTEEFEIEVTYDPNRYITDAKLVPGSPVNRIVPLVDVSYTKPSTSADDGYNDNDRGIVNIEVKNYPAVQFEITNMNRADNTTKISGTNYKVTSNTNEEGAGVTNPTAIIYLGRGAFNNTITYTITETAPAARHQAQLVDSIIEVDFDSQGMIDTVSVNGVRVIKNADITTAVAAGRASYADSLKVNVEIKSNPKLAIELNKVNEKTGVGVQGVDFEVTAQIKKADLQNYDAEKLEKIMKSTVELSEDSYLEEALYRIKVTKDDIQAIKQTIAIERIVKNLKDNNNLTADQENEIMQGISYTQQANIITNMKKSTITAITQTVNSITIQEVANKLINDGKTTQDTINDIISDLKDLVRLDVDRVTTDRNGNATVYLGKTLEGKTIEYTLKETKKADGYDWPDEVVRFEVTYDDTGKMIQQNPIKVISGNFDISTYSINGFSIGAEIRNTPSKALKIHIVAEDVYDSDKKLEVAKFDAYLIDPNAVNSYGRLTFAPDNKYKTTLATGSTQNGTGTVVNGEDTESLGIYKEKRLTRILRLHPTQTPSTYYKNNTAYSAAYQPLPYKMLIQLSFDDEGHVTGSDLYHPGQDDDVIGIISDRRYIEVTHSMNTIEIKVKYYPMLQVQMVTKDMYTEDALKASYTITTDIWGSSSYNYIKSGYINPHSTWHDYWFGRDYGIGYKTDASLPTAGPWESFDELENLYGAAKVALAPTEAEKTDSRKRTFYVYENSEPTSPMQYQKYRNRDLTQSKQHLLATIEVTYNELGEIDDNVAPRIISARSTNNIQSNFIELKAHKTDEYTIQLTVKYAPITTISANVIDAVSGLGIGGIRIDPYQYNSNVSNQSYEYRYSNNYYITGSNGKTGWTYWGGSIAGGKVYYKMTTSNYYSDIYYKSGYFNPGPIILEVLYDENGRVTTAAVKTTDQFGDPNAINISWDDKNHISITIPYQRQFLVNIGKVSYDDSTEKLPGARFRIESSKGVLTEFNGNSGNHVVGKVYPGKTVRYTITETQFPYLYTSVGTMYVDVEFNNDGTIRNQTSSEPDYYQFLNEISLENNVCTGMRIDIKNKLAFSILLDVKDKFYPTLGVEGATYEITNNKGDKASGTLITDKNGRIDVTVGTIYKGKIVEYTIKQTNKANGYYINPQEIKFVVDFNNGGDIRSYTVTNGNNVITDISKVVIKNNYNSTFQDHGIHIATYNMPEDIKVGIEKTDKATNSPMAGISFNVKTEEVGKVTKDYNLVTNADGKVVDLVDKFVESNDYRKVKYTISEIQVPDSYRKIEDVQIEVTYNKDGSMFLKDVISNPSNVEVFVAVNQQISSIDEIPTHIKLRIPNDNAYDLIIKNEDKDYAGLGIEGTKYDVTINGTQITPSATNKDGFTRIANRNESGNIEIRITERTPGEGYREEPNNTATIVLNKGTNIYSLKVDDAELTNKGYTYKAVADTTTGNITYDIVIAQTTDPITGQTKNTNLKLVVNESKGTLQAIFYNETKLELNLVKDDINTGKLLEGAIFEITAEELDNTGNTVAGTLKTITNTHSFIDGYDDNGKPIIAYNIDEEEKTDKNGLITFDLGKAHQNKTIKYTLNEVVTPEEYTPIAPIHVTVKFDTYGRITDITDDSFRANCNLDSNTGKSHNMIFNISNGTVAPQYSIKVVSADSQTGTRINGSIFQVEVFDAEGKSYKPVTGTTKDLTKTIGNNTFVVEKGVMKVTGIQAEGNIKIKVDQKETATGYVYGSNKYTGEVLANATFTASTTELDEEVTLTVDPNSGFDVTVDNVNREITIRVKNDPELTFDITKIDGKTKEKLSGAEFTVTSIMQTAATTVPTTLDETSALTDENGHTTLNGGMIQASRTMIYTLKENNKLEGYDQLDDIVLLVQYDTKGNISYYEILSDVNDARVIKDIAKVDEKGEIIQGEFIEKAEIIETKRVLGETDVPGIVEAEYSTYKIPTGVGTKKLQLEVSNTPEIPNDYGYQIVIEKHQFDVYEEHLPGVTFEITVRQEYGKAKTTWIDTTDNTGFIKSQYFDGYGKIIVELKEIGTVDGFKLNPTVTMFQLSRDKETHELKVFNAEGADFGIEISKDKSQVILHPVNEQASNRYSMVINKVDKNSNMLITNNPAEFEVYRIDEYKTQTEVVDEATGDITYNTDVQEIKQLVLNSSTHVRGIITANNLMAPEEEGTYKYVVKETKAPEGYVLPTEEMELYVTFTKNAADELIISEVKEAKGNENIKVGQVKDQLFSLIVLNTNEKDVVQDGEYSLNILKVDTDKTPITTDTAIFKLTNMQTNEVNYYETNDQGKLDIEAFKMPEEEGTYIYKLNEVKAPSGYVLNLNDIMLELEFVKDAEGKMYLSNVKVTGDNIEYIEPEEGELPDTTITVKVINEEGGGAGNVNDKRYTFVLNKVDSETKEKIDENVEFEVVLANGEIVKGKTNDDSQLRIEDVFMPAKPGEYELVIKEKTHPKGYVVDNEDKVVMVTFTGYGNDMVISNITLKDTNNKNIEILEDKCTDQYIEVNILNEKDAYEELYVVSKKYNKDYQFYDSKLEDKNNQSQIYKDGEDIYQVLDGFYGVEGYKNPHYTIDEPFIDTKIAKYKSYVLAEEFIGNLESNGHMEVLGYDGQPIGPQDHVGTGMTLRSTLGDQELTFVIVVKGDADYKDEEKTAMQIGRVSATDYDKLIEHLSKRKVITDPIALRALDIDFDGRVRATDQDEMEQLLAGKTYYDYYTNDIDKSDIKYVKP